MTTTQTACIISASYSYYAGTINAPKNGALRKYYRLEFSGRDAAADYLIDHLGCEKDSDGSYSVAGTYCTRHGEYARPVYRIRKLAVR